MILLLDNYDSFTYNLAQYFGELGCEIVVKRNDEVSLDEVEQLAPTHICISPGPCTPRQAGISSNLVRQFGERVPILGVCLGHQCIAEAYGAEIVRSCKLVHGKASKIKHNGSSVMAGLPNPFVAGRYHSLTVARGSLPECLEITAEAPDGEVMGVRHIEHQVHGVQFHPESILTPNGKSILANFLQLATANELRR